PIDRAAGLGYVEIATEPIVVALPSGHPLTRRRRVRREELAGVPLVFFPRHYSPGYYDRVHAQVYGSVTAPNIVRTEPEEAGLPAPADLGIGFAPFSRWARASSPARSTSTPRSTAATSAAPSPASPRRRGGRTGPWSTCSAASRSASTRRPPS